MDTVTGVLTWTPSPTQGDAVVLSLAQAPVGAVLDAVTGVLTWTPSPTQGGAQGIVLAVKDDRGGEDMQSFVIDVAPSVQALPAPPIDADSDGFTADVDCDDGNAAVNPAQIEILGNGLDDDCNPATPDEIPAAALWCDVVSLKRAFGPGLPVQLRTSVRNVDDAVSLTDGALDVTIRDAAAQVHHSENLAISSLTPGGLRRDVVRLAAGDLPAGTYDAVLTVRFGGETRCESAASFRVAEDVRNLYLPFVRIDESRQANTPTAQIDIFLPLLGAGE